MLVNLYIDRVLGLALVVWPQIDLPEAHSVQAYRGQPPPAVGQFLGIGEGVQHALDDPGPAPDVERRTNVPRWECPPDHDAVTGAECEAHDGRASRASISASFRPSSSV